MVGWPSELGIGLQILLRWFDSIPALNNIFGMIYVLEINKKDSKFGTAFGGKNFTQFYSINIDEYTNIGEVEFDPKQSEILSIYIDTSFRGKGIGKEVINHLFKLQKTDKIVAWAAKSSIPFWKKIATERLKNDYFIIEKNK